MSALDTQFEPDTLHKADKYTKNYPLNPKKFPSFKEKRKA